jgi:hypothetical protein
VPSPCQAEPLVWVGQGRMAMGAAPPPPGLLGAMETRPGCPACDHPNTPARWCPGMGHSEEVAWVVPLRRPLPGIRVSERHQRRLLRMHAHAKAGTPRGPHRHDPCVSQPTVKSMGS